MRSLSLASLLVPLACFATVCTATTLKEVSFEDLVASSDQIVSGHVTRTWTSWGSQHKFIWTRYEIAVEDVWRGPKDNTVVVSEPGGVLDGRAMDIESAVRYQVGEHVTLFLHQFPSGDKRTVGWGQGKFTIDGANRVHAAASGGVLPRRPGVASATPVESLNGISYADLQRRVAAIAPRSVSK